MRLSVLAFVMLISGNVVVAQETPGPALERLPVGAVLRYRSIAPPTSIQQAALLGTGRDSLYLRIDSGHGDSTALALPYDRLALVEVSVPRSRVRGALRGFGIGVLGAVAVGVALVAFAGTRNDGDTDLTSALVGVLATPTIIVGGTLIGAAHPGNRWKTVHEH